MYKLTPTKSITRLTDGACIPVDPDNNDYAEYLKWVMAGNIVTPADVVPPPTKAQRIAALVATTGETRLTVQMTITVCEDKATAMSTALGMPAPAAIALAYSKNKSYRMCKDLETAIQTIERSP